MLYGNSPRGARAAGALRALGIATLLAALGLPAASAPPRTGEVKAQILDEQKAPIARGQCRLAGPSLPAQGLEVVSGDKGVVDFPGLVWGTYTITCAAAGYRPLSQANLELSPERPLLQVEMALPRERVLRQQVEVRASPGAVPEHETGAPPAKLVSEQLVTLPLAEMSFRAALPLVPGVVRLPNGKVNIKGETEMQGLLLVDSTELVDPVTGSFSVEVPIDIIESLEVYKSPYLAEYGGFSGGLTVIHSKPPASQWHWELDDPLPDFFVERDHFRGVQDETPRLYLTGPVFKDKLNISESFVYDLHKLFVEGLPWPKNLKKREGFSSFTDLQYVFSPRHLLSINARAFPTKEEFANISALIAQPASANYSQNGYAMGATDRYLLHSGGVLTSTFEFTRFNSHAYGQGPQAMLVTPTGYAGNYFNAYTRNADREEIEEAYQFPQWAGGHQLQAGVDYVRRAYTGTSDSHSVLVTGASLEVLERIDFSPPARLGDTDAEAGGFAHDHWTVNNHFSLDAGLRYSNETLGSHTAFAPRLGFAYSPGTGGRTVLEGGGGIFYDREPLLAGDFAANPTRTVSFFSVQGAPLGPPVVFANAYGIPAAAPGTFIPTFRRPETTPHDATWSLELDQQLHPGWVMRLDYLASYGRNQFVVHPQNVPGIEPAFLLSNGGSSHYQELVSTLRVRPGEKADMNFSYVYSRARGDLNSLSEVYVPFERPIIQPDFYASLPSDVPSRFITWSQFRLPRAMVLSPVFDIHSGFPFSRIDVFQNYAAAPNSSRFPLFYSFDVKWTKEFHMSPLRLSFFKQHIFRAGFAVFDITNHYNPLDVYNNTASPYFGHFAGLQHRTLGTYFDLVK